jgi:hypothetical protein
MDLIDEIIDDVHEYSFVDLPFKKGARIEQPEIGISDYNKLREVLIARLDDWVKKVKGDTNGKS